MTTDTKRRNFKHYLRKSHRYLGVFIGIQFILWTAGGLFFSWTDIDEIHGDHLRKDLENTIDVKQPVSSPQTAVESLLSTGRAASIVSIRVVEIDEYPVYEIGFRTPDGKKDLLAADAATGAIRDPITDQEARQIAQRALKTPQNVASVEYLTSENVGAHHEYREKPLPAWAVTFDSPEKVTVYLAANTGQIGAVRTGNWRIFDFLWMMHTMDFQARDDFNNYLLRGFSVLGVVTIFSGFVLFFASSKFWRGLIRNRTRT